MYDTRAKTSIKGLLGWRAHWDATEIPAFTNTALAESETGEYYQQERPFLRLDYIKQMLPQGRPLEGYLEEIEDDAVTMLLDAVVEHKKITSSSKDVVNNVIIRNAISYGGAHINEGRFVGVEFMLKPDLSLRAIINRFALYTTQAQTDLTMYLYHEHASSPIATYTFNSTAGKEQTWSAEVAINLEYSNETLAGGRFFFGYYQDDLAGQAKKYNKLNWSTGFCTSCDGGRSQKQYKSIEKHVSMRSFYVASSTLDAGRDLFDINQVFHDNTATYGLNFNISIRCNLTQFWIDNRTEFKTALKKQMQVSIMRDMLSSSQINYIEQGLQGLIVEQLPSKEEELKEAIKNITLDQGNLTSLCLPCAKKPRTFYKSV